MSACCGNHRNRGGLRQPTTRLVRARRVRAGTFAHKANERWSERWIESTGEWSYAKDVSEFGGAWLYVPSGSTFASGTRTVRVVGFFRCTGSRDFDGRRDGHGPFGLAPAELDAFELYAVESGAPCERSANESALG